MDQVSQTDRVGELWQLLADLVYGPIAKGDLYVLPNFTDDASQATAQGIGLGRAKGENAYPRVMQALFSQLQQAPQ